MCICSCGIFVGCGEKFCYKCGAEIDSNQKCCSVSDYYFKMQKEKEKKDKEEVHAVNQ